MKGEYSEMRSEEVQHGHQTNTCCRLEQTTAKSKHNESVECRRSTLVRSDSEPELASEKWSSTIRVFSALKVDHDDRSILRSSTRAFCTPSSTSSTVVIATEELEELSPQIYSRLRPTAMLARSSSEPNFQESQSPTESVIGQNFFKSLAKRIRAEREAFSHEEPH
jgi:hypothetical protein